MPRSKLPPSKRGRIPFRQWLDERVAHVTAAMRRAGKHANPLRITLLASRCLSEANSALGKPSLMSIVRKIWAAIDEEVRHRKPPNECSVGCFFCCHLEVASFGSEILTIADHILRTFTRDDLGLLKRRMDDWIEKSEGKEGKFFHLCPLNQNGLCTIYECRPLACRSYLSRSVKDCEASYHTEYDAGPLIPLSEEIQEFAADAGLAATLTSTYAGIGYLPVRMIPALRFALDHPNVLESEHYLSRRTSG